MTNESARIKPGLGASQETRIKINTMKHHNIGRGKIMSIAKAAVIEFHESKSAFVYSGDLDFFHRVIDRAGAEHVGPGTHHAVLACIRSSPLWKRYGTIRGWGNGRANTYVPA